MAAPYATTAGNGGYSHHNEMRSVTPATANTRNTNRYASAPRLGGAPTPVATPTRSMTPNREGRGGTTPPSGLIRLTLKKPMGIVFEPMYDPHAPQTQRGVRICDLPRTGAAALSRQLQVGDELLQINDVTVSRLTFDEIMDFIIEADPEAVHLLFRRPRKETLQQRQGLPQKLLSAKGETTSTVKWVDEEKDEDAEVAPSPSANAATPNKESSGHHHSSSKDRKKKKKKKPISDNETLSTNGDDSYKPSEKKSSSSGNRKKKHKRGGDPYESESFLDLLIDTICSNPNHVCRDSFRGPKEEEYFSEDEESFDSHADESTYLTYEESVEPKPNGSGSKEKRTNHGPPKKRSSKEPSEDETDRDEQDRHRSQKQQQHHHDRRKPTDADESDDKAAAAAAAAAAAVPATSKAAFGKPGPPATSSAAALVPAAAANHTRSQQQQPPAQQQQQPPAEDDNATDLGNPAPIKEVEYDDRIDHGADVSVMESLGGPSLLIEKQRQLQQRPVVPHEVSTNFGLDFANKVGLTREQTIESDPLAFYTHVVKGLLTQYEPEKVRLLDKLLAKYKGREDHLVQKLSVRYNRGDNDHKNNAVAALMGAHAAGAATATSGDQDDMALADAIKKTKVNSFNVEAAVNTAKERMQDMEQDGGAGQEVEQGLDSSGAGGITNRYDWPAKEHKEMDEEDMDDDEEEGEEDEEDESGTDGSDYSGDEVDGTSPAVIAQVSELLNYVYGKTSVPGQIDRVSTIMRAYEGREAVLLELLETKALIKANKEKENADNLPSFLRNSANNSAQKNGGDPLDDNDMPPVTPMATQPLGAAPPGTTGPAGGSTVLNDDISSMSGVSSPQPEPHQVRDAHGIVKQSPSTDEVEVTHNPLMGASQKEAPSTGGALARLSKGGARPPITPGQDKKKKKGLFGGLFGGGKKRDKMATSANTPSAQTSMTVARGKARPGHGAATTAQRSKLKGAKSVEGSI